MNIKRIPIEKIELNTGQIEGLPANPRQWTRDDIDRIAASLKETPELFEMRPCIVYPLEGGAKFVLLAGNLRFCGARQNEMKDVPCCVVPRDMSIAKMKEIVLKDNGSWGAWDFDALANEWDDLPLTDWGIPAWNPNGGTGGGEGDAEKKKTEILSGLQYDALYYEPKNKPELRLADCINDEKFRAKIATLDEYQLTDEQKATLRMFAYRFLKIDFEAVANYYFFNATEEEKKAMERPRLVLVDNGSLGGFVEDAMIRISDLSREEALNNGDED